MNKAVDLKNRKVFGSQHLKIGEKNRKGQTYTDPNDFYFNQEGKPNFLTGSEVIRQAIKQASVGISVAYPITPQSEAAALIGELFAEGVHHHGRTGYPARDGKFPHVGGRAPADPGLCDLPRGQFPLEHSAGYFGDALSPRDGNAGLACGNRSGPV